VATNPPFLGKARKPPLHPCASTVAFQEALLSSQCSPAHDQTASGCREDSPEASGSAIAPNRRGQTSAHNECTTAERERGGSHNVSTIFFIVSGHSHWAARLDSHMRSWTSPPKYQKTVRKRARRERGGGGGERESAAQVRVSSSGGDGPASPTHAPGVPVASKPPGWSGCTLPSCPAGLGLVVVQPGIRRQPTEHSELVALA
jgi:hypothetical protein